VKSVQELPEAVEGVLRDQDLLLTIGAGDVGNGPALLTQKFGVTV
jgi:hypothetical protein